MDILEANKLVLFIGFVIPGFISIKTYSLFSPTQYKESEKLLIDAVTYSCINYAILGPFIYLIIQSNVKSSCAFLYWFFYFFVMFIAPIIWAALWLKLRSMQFFQKHAPHPTPRPWDFVFSQQKQYWVIVTLSSGKQIAGRYGENSFTSSYPEDPQIYLEEAWHMNDDGGFGEKREQSAGIILLSKDIQSVELFN